MNENYYGEAITKQLLSGIGGLSYEHPTKREQLENKKLQLTRELAKTQAALDALDANPELEKFFDLIQNAL